MRNVKTVKVIIFGTGEAIFGINNIRGSVCSSSLAQMLRVRLDGQLQYFQILYMTVDEFFLP